jgi:hypothetical protein
MRCRALEMRWVDFASRSPPPGRAAAASLGMDFFHELGEDDSIQSGMDGVERVWAGVISASGVTERAVAVGPGLNLARADPRGLTRNGPRSRPGGV